MTRYDRYEIHLLPCIIHEKNKNNMVKNIRKWKCSDDFSYT